MKKYKVHLHTHGIYPPQYWYANTTRCPVCTQQFHTRPRLREHYTQRNGRQQCILRQILHDDPPLTANQIATDLLQDNETRRQNAKDSKQQSKKEERQRQKSKHQTTKLPLR